MAARLDRGPVRFDLQVTVAAEGDDPHDPMSVWKGARELSAGTVEVTSPRRPRGGRRRSGGVRPGARGRRDHPVGGPDPAVPRRAPTRCRWPVARSQSVASSPVKTLVIGTGGREHALARALALDPGVTEVHAAPGNPGMAAVATLHDVDPMSGQGRGRPGRAARCRPGRGRPGGAAGRRGGRRRDRAGHRLLRPVERGRAARGLEGVRQGRDGGGRCADRGGAGLPHPRRGRGRAGRVRGAVRREGRRPRRRQGCRGHRRPRRPRSTMRPAASGS